MLSPAHLVQGRLHERIGLRSLLQQNAHDRHGAVVNSLVNAVRLHHVTRALDCVL